jgi:hypothetical protein
MHGVKDATVNPDRILGWWSTTVVPNIAIACEPSGVVVIDIDLRHGGDKSLAQLEAQRSAFPPTWTAVTGGGGRHYYFQAPAAAAIKNSAGVLAEGIDIRGHGGYVVVPPSGHISGRRYTWHESRAPWETLLAPLPDWIRNALAAPKHRKAMPASEWRRLICRDIADGERNDTLTRITGHLLRHYIDPILTHEIVQSINQTHCVPPLGEDEVTRIVDSICGRELARRNGAR